MKEIEVAKALDPLRGAAGAGDAQALRWHPPTGARLEVWSALLRFARHKTSTGKTNWLWFPIFDAKEQIEEHKAFAFRWTVIAGQAGAGKSRMAMECARYLAKSEFFETASAWERFGAEWGERWGRWLPWARRHPRHFWDTGLLEDGLDVKRLERWRPRRPTFLLMDDPKPGECKKIIEALYERGDHFTHPVRLLIVDQALPIELGFTWGAIQGGKGEGWRTEVKGFHGEVRYLDAQSRLDFPAVSKLALGLGLPKAIWADVHNVQVQRFVREMRGNALLVELGLREVKRAGLALEHVAEAGLIDRYVERIERIVEALKLGGLKEVKHLQALAAATISGTADGDGQFVDREHAKEKHPIYEAYGEIDRELLQRLFNLAQNSGSMEVPPVRPELIGDAFVRWVLDKKCTDQGERPLLIETAWRTNPLGVLRTYGRVGKRGDLLAEWLGKGPPAEVDAKLDAVQLALAYAAVPIRVPQEDDELGLAGDTEVSLKAAVERIRGLTPEQAKRLEPELQRLASDMQGDRVVVRAWETLVCLSAAVLAQAGQAEDEAQVARLTQVLIGAMRSAVVAGRDGVYGDAVIKDAAETVLGKLPVTVGMSVDGLEAVLERVLAELKASSGMEVTPGEKGVAQRQLVTRLFESFDVPPLCEREQFPFERARAWVSLSEAQTKIADVDGCRESLSQVEAVVDGGFKGRAAFEELRAISLKLLSHAQAGVSDLEGCKVSVMRVEKISMDEKFKGQAEFEVQRAGAWLNLSQGQLKLSHFDGCRESVARVEAVVLDGGFKGQARFEELRASAWLNLSQAQRLVQDLDGFCESVGRIEAIVLEGRFQGQSAFEILRVAALVNLSAAEADATDIDRCREAVRRVDEIVREGKFQGQEAFEMQRVKALGNLGYALSKVGDVRGCRESANRVEEIVDGGFRGNPTFEKSRAIALSNLAACSRSGDAG